MRPQINLHDKWTKYTMEIATWYESCAQFYKHVSSDVCINAKKSANPYCTYVCLLNLSQQMLDLFLRKVARSPNQPSPRSLFHPSTCLFPANMVAKCSVCSYAMIQIIPKLWNDGHGAKRCQSQWQYPFRSLCNKVMHGNTSVSLVPFLNIVVSSCCTPVSHHWSCFLRHCKIGSSHLWWTHQWKGRWNTKILHQRRCMQRLGTSFEAWKLHHVRMCNLNYVSLSLSLSVRHWQISVCSALWACRGWQGSVELCLILCLFIGECNWLQLLRIRTHLVSWSKNLR